MISKVFHGRKVTSAHYVSRVLNSTYFKGNTIGKVRQKLNYELVENVEGLYVNYALEISVGFQSKTTNSIVFATSAKLE